MRQEIQQANNWDVTRHYLLTVTISCGGSAATGRLLFAAGQLIVSVTLALISDLVGRNYVCSRYYSSIPPFLLLSSPTP